jgi:hypothetical protein
MTPSNLRSSSHRFRAFVAALVAVMAWTIAGPVLQAAHSHDDDPCCRNGICCCKPKDLPPGPCIGGVCRCEGHDGEPSDAPAVRQVAPPAAFALRVQFLFSESTAPPASSPGEGFATLPFHPPRPRLLTVVS